MIVSFTGHRKISNPSYVKEELRKVLTELKPEKAISGMAIGVDTIAAELCIELGIPFIAAVPFKGQESIWPTESKKKYNELLSKASEVVIVSEGGYSAYKMQTRNIWMTDRCDKLIGVWDGSSGGTANCIFYAKSIGKEVIIINPKNYIISTPGLN